MKVASVLTENLAKVSGPTQKLTRQDLRANHPSSIVHHSSTHSEPFWAFSEHCLSYSHVKGLLSDVITACGAR